MLIIYEKDGNRRKGGCLTYRKDIPLKVVAEGLGKMWLENPDYRFEAHEAKPFSWFTAAAHMELLEGTAPVIDRMRTTELAQPNLKMVQVRDNWLVGQWEYDEKGLVPKEDEKGWFFCHRPEHQTAYFYFEVPFPWCVDNKGGIGRSVEGIYDIYYPPFRKPWPDPILCDTSWYEKPTLALGACNAMLKPGDTNPLTLLLRSTNPEIREKSTDVARQLQIIRNCLLLNRGVEKVDIR
ncbi:MAG: hypothetical protein U1C57_02585 [Candidatus Doudnabacteria bacterium]|nr:hypothetical protein [bacterium]MDZ4243969.1 hypothetical protein [Candidatus Doudnabacteria bacterium]